MAKGFRLLAVLIVLGMATMGVANAGNPDPSLSVIPNVLYSSGGTLEYIVVINGAGGPIVGSTVDLVFTAVQGLICWCDGQPQPLVSAVTDVNGEAHFFIAAGGCVDLATTGGLGVDVYASSLFMTTVGCVSPDAVDGGGVLPVDGWNPGTTCETGLADGSFHTPPVKSGTYEFCTDFDSNGSVSLGDAGIMTPGLKSGAICVRQ